MPVAVKASVPLMTGRGGGLVVVVVVPLTPILVRLPAGPCCWGNPPPPDCCDVILDSGDSLPPSKACVKSPTSDSSPALSEYFCAWFRNMARPLDFPVGGWMCVGTGEGTRRTARVLRAEGGDSRLGPGLPPGVFRGDILGWGDAGGDMRPPWKGWEEDGDEAEKTTPIISLTAPSSHLIPRWQTYIHNILTKAITNAKL